MPDAEPLRLVAIGFTSGFTVYVNVSREEAIERYNREMPDYTVEEQGLDVKELVVMNGKFSAYEIETCNDDD